jgi:hypothetical protein
MLIHLVDIRVIYYEVSDSNKFMVEEVLGNVCVVNEFVSKRSVVTEKIIFPIKIFQFV